MKSMTDNIAFLFPGQGAQYVGMGKDLYDAYPSVRALFDAADSRLGYSLTNLCFNGTDVELTKTCFAQPAIFTASYAALTVLRENFPHIKPAMTAGLSLGEFSALAACRAISFEDGLDLVRKRAEAMEKSAQNHPGTMASILGLPIQICQQIAKDSGCFLANINSPEQIALSGSAESIDVACTIASSAGAKRAIPLKVGGAFHSPLMNDAREELEAALRSVAIAAPQCVFIPNVSAEPVSDPEQIRSLLASQLTSPVRWCETMKRAESFGFRCGLEIGPGKVLKGLARQCAVPWPVINCGSAADFQKLDETLNKLSDKP